MAELHCFGENCQFLSSFVLGAPGPPSPITYAYEYAVECFNYVLRYLVPIYEICFVDVTIRFSTLYITTYMYEVLIII